MILTCMNFLRTKLESTQSKVVKMFLRTEHKGKSGRCSKLFRVWDKVTDVSLCTFLYVFSIKKAVSRSLVIYKSISYTYIQGYSK